MMPSIRRALCISCPSDSGMCSNLAAHISTRRNPLTFSPRLQSHLRSAACADIAAVVSDDPCCSVGNLSSLVSAGRLKLEPGTISFPGGPSAPVVQHRVGEQQR